MTTLSILHLLSPTFIPDATLLTKSVNDRLGKKKKRTDDGGWKQRVIRLIKLSKSLARRLLAAVRDL